ncbi:unannotated protein [freshwater metagenome]|uniref:Unannotated protein n=1 Tax=freshwater metagenome TaxID=449393 RepID=A0A6J7FR49_9ZZZZ
MAVDPFKAAVIELALRAAGAHGFALAGGNALAAHGLLSRPTQDIDLFTPLAGGTRQVIDAVQTALAAGGYAVHVVRAADDGDFAELHVSRDDQTTQLDLGRDWRAHDAVPLELGPVLHLDDAVGSKTTALLGRALPRDFIDVAAALDRYSRRQLLELAFTRDQGLRAADAALAAHQLDRLDDAQFLPYQLSGHDVTALRERFASWPRDAATDDEAHAAHNAARRPPPSAARRAAAGFPTPVTDALQQPAPPPASLPASPGQHPPDKRSRRIR